MHDKDPAPDKWWLTALLRSQFDFDFAAGSATDNNFFRNMDTIAGYVGQRRKLVIRLEVLLIASFLIPSVIIAGGLPSDGKLGFLGTEIPMKIVTVPLLAALSAAIFQRYMQSLMSLTLLNYMIDKLLSEALRDGVEFVAARYEASMLWSNFFHRRRIGYQSPRPHVILTSAVGIAGILLILLHIVINCTAMSISIGVTYSTSGVWSFGFTISILSTVVTALTVLQFLFGYLIPLPYKMSPEMAEEMARQAAVKREVDEAAA